MPLNKELRLQAEQALLLTRHDIASRSSADMQSVVYELQIHQIELEMQNQSLHEAQDQLAESHAGYQELFECAPVAYARLDASGCVARANAAALALLNVPSTKLLGKQLCAFIAASDAAVFELGLRTTQQLGRATCEVALRSAIESWRYVRIDISVVPSNTAERLVMLTDVSERKALLHSLSRLTRDLEARAAELAARNLQLESEIAARVESEQQQQRLEVRLREAERLESLGLLAGGVAHDFNNLLVSVQGNAELLLMAPKLPRDQHRSLSLITRACQQASRLTRQLLVFAGQGEVSMTALEPAVAIAETMDLLQGRVPACVTVRCELGAELPKIRADRSQLSRVVLNLVTNALEALTPDAAGTIVVDARTERLDADALSEFQHHSRAVPGLFVVLSVRDSGPGIDARTMARIFDPFFSTKLACRGVGLASVLGIAQAHAGALRVRSKPGRGSCFELAFPVSESCGNAARPVSDEGLRWQGSGRILVIDDDGAVRRVTARLLSRIGFEVTQAGGGVSALSCLDRAEPGFFDLVVLDWRMPGMSGQQVLAALRKLTPALPVVVISGYSADHLESHDQHTVFLEKPVAVAQLRSTLRRLLSDPPVVSPSAR